MSIDETKRRAVALRYQSEKDPAPKIIGKGKGFIANEIIEQAKKHDIPIQKDPSLVEMLGSLELNQAIPEELYEVVAEVFSFIYRIDRNG
ncbi:EscU/YscU/HrcU family type III secretion system export apparatus switch protein [bacterium LRH843]|nr:EscU/YscU/HrcU family type III secretion system export apparatus switch protein [bacterium LRH843]